MNKLQKILKETVEYYTTKGNKRAVNNGECYYYRHSDGSRCAIRRLLALEDAKELESIHNGTGVGVENVWGFVKKSKPTIFKDEHVGFFQNLQTFHDDDSYWCGNKLTEEGEQRYNFLLQAYR